MSSYIPELQKYKSNRPVRGCSQQQFVLYRCSARCVPDVFYERVFRNMFRKDGILITTRFKTGYKIKVFESKIMICWFLHPIQEYLNMDVTIAGGLGFTL